ncbi:hypothetical protein M231_05684 [Tremella mesenterica]|uniref:Uncharacterized protein n=1 Tax=Tremella mesenterica TaxID=5217 RepID=A0A4Q1BHE3_TREME|nr:hypothetical protein M231_05684 [Tremella mesenterica]
MIIYDPLALHEEGSILYRAQPSRKDDGSTLAFGLLVEAETSSAWIALVDPNHNASERIKEWAKCDTIRKITRRSVYAMYADEHPFFKKAKELLDAQWSQVPDEIHFYMQSGEDNSHKRTRAATELLDHITLTVVHQLSNWLQLTLNASRVGDEEDIQVMPISFENVDYLYLNYQKEVSYSLMRVRDPPSTPLSIGDVADYSIENGANDVFVFTEEEDRWAYTYFGLSIPHYSYPDPESV